MNKIGKVGEKKREISRFFLIESYTLNRFKFVL